MYRDWLVRSREQRPLLPAAFNRLVPFLLPLMARISVDGLKLAFPVITTADLFFLND